MFKRSWTRRDISRSLGFLCPILCSTQGSRLYPRGSVPTRNLVLPVIAPLLVLLTLAQSANDSAMVVCTFESSRKAGKESEGLTKFTSLLVRPRTSILNLSILASFIWPYFLEVISNWREVMAVGCYTCLRMRGVDASHPPQGDSHIY